MPEFYMIFAWKINKIPEFYVILPKNIFPKFWGQVPRAPSPSPMI